MNSSYNNNVTFGDVLDSIVFSLNPKKIVEVGILEGFSLKRFAESSNKDTLIRAYDIFEEFNGNHAKKDKLVALFKDYDNVSINYGNFYEVHKDISDVDIIHIDIANNGNVYEYAIKHYIPKLLENGILIMEGGSEQRDNVEWMIKYNKPKIQPVIQKYNSLYDIKTICEDKIWNKIKNNKYQPAITLIRKKSEFQNIYNYYKMERIFLKEKTKLFEKFHDKTFNYSNEYKFEDILKNIYKVDKLENIVSKNVFEITKDNDQKKPCIRTFYESEEFLTTFKNEYEKFIKNEISKIFTDEEFIVYQGRPTFRIQEANSVAVGEWHRDSQQDYDHFWGEINVFLPFTSLNKYNTIWKNFTMEDETIGENAKPIIISKNQYQLNYLNQVKHGNIINKSNITRVSIDFRIIPGSIYKYNTNIKQSADMKFKFDIGGYYKKLTLR